MRKQEYLVQGSPEWLQFRLEHDGASEAGAMLGISKLSTRNELLKIKSTGISKEFSDYVQRFVLDKGHEVEALARPIVESIIDDQLYPVTFSMGRLSASCDGLTGMGDIAFEHKQWNEVYAEMIRNGELPEEHWPQCQQVLLITGADKLIFVISDGTQENLVWMWVYPDQALQERIVSGWAQFDRDLAEYVHAEIAEKPIAEPTESLPAVSIRVDGGLAVISNLDLFGKKLREFVGNLTKDPKDDQDFANLEQAVKDLKKAEDALAAAEDMALAQISDVNDMRRTVADLKDIARSHRLTSEKLVKSQKEVIKLKILSDIKDRFNAH
ncbi:MAG: YqaJ viral recombinase family protein, partial [Methylobacter sp.]